jgi:putative ABC transport system substrate-binding protein
MLALVLVLLTRSLAGPPRPGAGVLVVTSPLARDYVEAVEGLRELLTAAGVASAEVALGARESRSRLASALAGKPDLVVAVGSQAVEAVAMLDAEVPVVATMVLAAANGAGKRPAAAITLEVPPEAVLRRLKQLYPARRRIAVLRGPALSDAAVAAIRAQARELDFKVRFVDCPGPKQLLEALGPLRGQADFLWCFPDSALYAGPVVSQLILDSIRLDLPLIGFSEGMVRAGALIGFFPDYRDVGRQTAEAVLRMLDGNPVPLQQHPRKTRVAVNERARRVLGLEHARGAETGLEIVR